jgi:CBS domain-containing protein
MQARDIMTTWVVTVGPDEPVTGIARTLTDHHISAVPVVGENGALLGIVSEGDLLRRPEIGTEKRAGLWWLNLWSDPSDLADDFTKAHGRTARDVMTAPAISVGPEAPLSEIAETLERNHIKRVPIVEGGRVVGLISRANIIREIASAGAVTIDSDADDEAIRRAVDKALSAQRWASYGTTSVTVKEGRVEFWGVVGSDSERAATRVLAEEIAGVSEVVDHRALRSRVKPDVA